MDFVVELFKSVRSRSDFLVPLGHSTKPNRTILYFLAFGVALVLLTVCWTGGSGLVAGVRFGV